MNIQINQIQNNTAFQKCSCCDADINLYSTCIEFTVNLNMDILAQSKSEANETAIEVLENLNFETAIIDDLVQYVNLTNSSIN